MRLEAAGKKFLSAKKLNSFASALFSASIAISPSLADDYYSFGNNATSIATAGEYSNTDGSTSAATVTPGASDNLFFYNSTLSSSINLVFITGATARTFNSMNFRSYAGTTQINRAATSSSTATVVSIGSGGITMDSGAGAVTIGRLASSGNEQRVVIGVVANFTVTNNSSNDLTFNRAFDGRTNNTTHTVTINGSGSGNTVFVEGIRANTTGRDLAMTINTSGTGIVKFEGTNDYTGATTINAGTLQIGNGGSTGNLSTSSAITNNGTLIFYRNNTLSQGTDFASVIAGTGKLVQAGTGALTLSGTNTYTGGTVINGGTLSITSITNGGVAGTLGNSTNAAGNLVLGGGELVYTGSTTSTDRSFTLSNGTSSTINVTQSGTALTISGGAASTSGALVKAGDGTLTLTGNNSYNGSTTISAGTIRLQNSASNNQTIVGDITISGGQLTVAATNQIADTAAVTLTSGSIELSSYNETINSLNMSGGSLRRSTNALTLNSASSFTGGSLNFASNTARIISNATTTLGNVLTEQTKRYYFWH